MFLDSTIIIDIFMNRDGQERFEELTPYMEDESLFISAIQVAEISDWCQRYDIDGLGAMDILREFVNVVPLDEIHCIEGANLKNEMRAKGVRKFGIIDGIILATAHVMRDKLLTRDKDFRKDSEAIVL